MSKIHKIKVEVDDNVTEEQLASVLNTLKKEMSKITCQVCLEEKEAEDIIARIIGRGWGPTFQICNLCDGLLGAHYKSAGICAKCKVYPVEVKLCPYIEDVGNEKVMCCCCDYCRCECAADI